MLYVNVETLFNAAALTTKEKGELTEDNAHCRLHIIVTMSYRLPFPSGPLLGFKTLSHANVAFCEGDIFPFLLSM